MRQFRIKKYRHIKGLSFSPNGTRLLALSGYESHGIERATYLDVATGEPIHSLEFVAEKYALAPDHSRLILGAEVYSRSSAVKFVRWCDPRAGKPIWENLKTGTGWPAGTSCLMPLHLALSPQGTRLFVALGQQRFPAGSTAAAWTYHLAICPLEPPGPPTFSPVAPPILEIALHPSEGRWAAITALARRTSVVLMGRTGEPLARFEPSGIRSSLGRLAYSPDGRLLAVLAGRTIHLLAGDTLQPVAELTRFTKQVNALAFSNDSRTLLSASHDGAVRLWDVASGTVRTAYDWRIGPVTALAFSTDGLLGATASNKGSIVIWDVAE